MEINITPKKIIDIDISPKKPKITIDVGYPHSGTPYPIYEGPTTITPEAYEMQILQTEKKSVLENIVVLPIPYFETSNPQGGNTVYIGE